MLTEILKVVFNREPVDAETGLPFQKNNTRHFKVQEVFIQRH